jgi:hypothetical protein
MKKAVDVIFDLFCDAIYYHYVDIVNTRNFEEVNKFVLAVL